MKAALVRSSYIAILWAGGGLGAWLSGGGVGATGWLLGMVSRADLYWSLEDRPRRFWLMLALAMIGIRTGVNS